MTLCGMMVGTGGRAGVHYLHMGPGPGGSAGDWRLRRQRLSTACRRLAGAPSAAGEPHPLLPMTQLRVCLYKPSLSVIMWVLPASKSSHVNAQDMQADQSCVNRAHLAPSGPPALGRFSFAFIVIS